MKVTVKNCGSVGVIKDLSVAELPIEAWTDSLDVRFLDGYARQFLGHGEVYDSPSFAPQFVMACNVGAARYWLYATATKTFVVTNAGGATTHTDITHLTPRTGVVNQWTGFVFFGLPILNTGDALSVPMYWDAVLANKFVNLPAWPAATYCKTLCQFKNFIVAINITAAGVNYPHRIRWSAAADPGSLPTTYDVTDATKEAGQFDVGEGQDPAVFALGLKEQLIIYKEASTYAMDFVSGAFVFASRRIFGMSGILNKHCAVEFDSFHFAVTGSDIVIHDGFTATSVLDKRARRFFFQDIDVNSIGKAFCFKNPFLNEIYVAYPSIGATSCNKALVYNFVDKTVAFRTLPNVNHAAYGPVDNTLGGSWGADSDPWSADLTSWDGPDFTPDTARVLMASADTKLFMLDASASFDGSLPDAFIERRGLHLDMPERRKVITGIRPFIVGNTGDTVIVKVGASSSADDPYSDPTYTEMTFTIGETLKCDCFVDARFIAIRFETGTAYQWRLDGYTIFFEDGGEY